MKKILMVTMATALAGLGTAAWAGPDEGPGQGRGERPNMERRGPPEGGGGNREMMGARILERLLDHPDKMKEFGITEEQAATLQASFYELEKNMVTLQGEAELAQIELRRLMDADETDEKALMAAVDKVGLTRTAIQKAKIQQRLNVQKVLGADTLKKIKGMVGDRMRQRRGGEDDDQEGPRMSRPRREGKGGGDAPWQQDEMRPPRED